MNIITGIRDKGGGFYWHNNEDNISRWSATVDLIPESKLFSEAFKEKYYIKIKNVISDGK